MDSICTVILAAGKGKRLKTSFPKPLAPVLGRKMVDHVVSRVSRSGINSSFCVVTGHGKEEVESHIQAENYFKTEKIQFALQDQQLGTGHALKCAYENSELVSNSDYTLVVCADTPCLEPGTFIELSMLAKNTEAVVVTFQTERPSGYGRVFDNGVGGVKIIEEKDATEEQREQTIVNSGVYFFKTSFLKDSLAKLDSNNAAGEFYLTDVFNFTQKAKAINFKNQDQFMGVNDLVQLSRAEKYLRDSKLKELMYSGVILRDPESTYITEDVEIGSETFIHHNVEISGQTKIGKNVTIEQGCIIRDSKIEAGSIIKANSYIDQSYVGKEVKIGPMAQLRPDSEVMDGSKIGNFVELKKAKLDKNVSVSHLSYVGDAEVGSGANLGCGFISCNYDGAKKHLTKIGKNTFIGSDSQMIAPISIGDNCYVASGSTINQDMPDGAFAIARARQETKEGLAKRFLKSK